MNTTEYKNKKYDKMTRDVVHLVNNIPTFGFGDAVDGTVKTALINYLLTIVNVSENFNVDVEILSQSVSDEIESLTKVLSANMLGYKLDLFNTQE